MPFQFIDLHCDTIGDCYFGKEKGIKLKDRKGHINIQKLINGGCMAQAFAMFIPTNGQGLGRDGKTLPWDIYLGMLKSWNENIDANSDVLRRAYCAEDIRENARNGFMSALLTVEDGIGIDGKIERLIQMYSDGVRMLALTWNYENSIAYPNSADEELHKKGLKDFGFEVVEKMNDLGMIIDVSHLSEGGFWDVIKTSKKPIVASHSCSRALCSHQRNLTDDQLKAIAKNGGVAGINFYSRFLCNDSDYTYTEDIIRHLKHFYNVAGIDTLALGSDFDGIDCELEFKDYEGMNLILSQLEQNFSESEIDKITHENFLRIF